MIVAYGTVFSAINVFAVAKTSSGPTRSSAVTPANPTNPIARQLFIVYVDSPVNYHLPCGVLEGDAQLCEIRNADAAGFRA